MIRISVITVSYNSAGTIEDTIKSVISQDYSNFEYLIIDGGSTDNTLSIINRYRDKISRVISEKDKGIYDAIAKGFRLAEGEVVVALNSDDMYASSDVLSQVASLFETSRADAVYGDLHYVNRYDPSKIVRKWIAGKYTDGMFRKGWMPPHPTFFARKSCYEKYGYFNPQLRSAADYELMLRFLHKHKIKVAYLPKLIVCMRTGGQSNVSLKNRLKANREDRLAWKLNGLEPGLFTLVRKPLGKIKQYFLKKG